LERLSRFGFRCSIILVTLSLPNLSPFQPINYLHELNISLGAYYLVAHFLAALLLLLTLHAAKPRRIHIISLLLQLALGSAYAAILLPYCYANERHIDEGKYSLLYANVYRNNPTPELLAKQIDNLQPDIVALTEYYSALDPILKLEKSYPHSVRRVREDCFGMALYSKFPISPDPIVSLGGDLPPAIIASIELSQQPALTLALTHSIPPLSQQAIYSNTLTMRRVAQRMRHAEEPVLVVGDFNATPFSWFYQGFVSITNMHDASYGYGLRKTWNANEFWMWFIIDHVFINDRLGVQQVERLDSIGSDHYPLLVRFGLR